MGGIGKTLLAEEYSLRFSASYPGGIFWLSAAAPTDVAVVGYDARNIQTIRFAAHLGLPTKDMTLDQIEGLLKVKLSRAERYLWLVDDLPPTADVSILTAWSAPTGNGVTLVT